MVIFVNEKLKHLFLIPCADDIARFFLTDDYHTKVLIPRRDVAQPGSALRSGRRSRRFKSGHPDHFILIECDFTKFYTILFSQTSYKMQRGRKFQTK